MLDAVQILGVAGLIIVGLGLLGFLLSPDYGDAADRCGVPWEDDEDESGPYL